MGNFYSIGDRPLRVAVPGYSELYIAEIDTTYYIAQNGYRNIGIISSEEGFEKSIPFWFLYVDPQFSATSGGWSILFRFQERVGGQVVAEYDVAGASMQLAASFIIQCNEVAVTPQQYQPSDKVRFVEALKSVVVRSRYEGETLRKQVLVARIDNQTDKGGDFRCQYKLGIVRTRS